MRGVVAWSFAVVMACAGVRAAGLVDRAEPDGGQVVGDFVGAHDMRRPARVLGGRGEALTYELAVERGRPATIEIEEVHGRGRGVAAYAVLVDGVRRAVRTWEGCGAGTVHRWVEVPATDGDRVRVRIENVGDVPVAIGRVWAYSDFESYFAAAAMDVPYRVAPTVSLKWDDRAADVARVRRVAETIGDHPHVRPAWTTFVAYAKWDEGRVRERIDYVVAVAREAGVPVQVCFDSWWGSTPHGPDGKGGNWWDEQYQQVVWDETAKVMRLSVPNRWANTPWLTMSHPDLNAFKSRRLEAAARHLAARYRELVAEGRQDLVLAVNLDNEPAYWASGGAGLGDHLLWADFNPKAVEAARRDGVVLDPRDGLAFDERRWLATNLLRYQEMIGAAAARGLASVGAEVGEPLADNVYTQGMVSATFEEFPMVDAAWPGWEAAASSAARVGGEWNADSARERAAVMHQVSLGRTANVNAEFGNRPPDARSVAMGYALGQRYYTPYNSPVESMGEAGAGLREVGALFPAPLHRRSLVEWTATGKDAGDAVASREHVVTGLIGNTPIASAYAADGSRPGVLTYVVDAPAGGFAAGLFLELSGRARDFGRGDPAVCLRVLAGRDEGSLALVRTFANVEQIDSRQAVDLSEVARGAKRVAVRLELATPGLPRELCSWVAVWKVRFTVPWEGEPEAEVPATLEASRRQNLLVSWRRDAELAIARLEKLGPGVASDVAAARASYDRGLYADAYRAAARAWGATVARPVTSSGSSSGSPASTAP